MCPPAQQPSADGMASPGIINFIQHGLIARLTPEVAVELWDPPTGVCLILLKETGESSPSTSLRQDHSI